MPPPPSLIVAHYDEIALKGANRRWFTGRLARAMRDQLEGCAVEAVEPVRGRVDVRLGPTADPGRVIERLRHVPGVASVAPMWRIPRDPDGIDEAVLALLPGGAPASFCVRVARADKSYPLSSPVLERRIGARIHEGLGWPVSLRHPALTVAVEIDGAGARCGLALTPGPGGLPVGTAGRVLCLLSGGVDSALAAWRMMRRGCRVDALHLHSVPITSDASQRAAQAMAGFLARGQAHVRLTRVCITDIQKHIALVAPPPLRTVLYRRTMVRIADRFARRARVRALVTGEALGQVASQTLENLATIDRVASRPVLRPLIGFDKREVVDEARRLGLPCAAVADEDDCCRVYAPVAAAIRSDEASCAAVEAEVPLEALIEAAMQAAERVIVPPDWADD